jgi:DDE superfamily endonuclease
MAALRFADMRFRPAEFLDFTSLTLEEFQILIPAFEAAFQAHMIGWRLDGAPRTARRFTIYQTCPLATPEDRLFFLLTYLKTYSLQVVQGRLFGMSQSKANQWIHVLLPALLVALRDLGDAPTRCLTALAQRLAVPGVVAVEAASADEPPPVALPSAAPVAAVLSPLLPMTGRSGVSSAPKTLLNRPHVTVARKRITR